MLIDYLVDFNMGAILLRLLLAVLCGGAIGIERGRRRQAAGFRTHILVCMGSALVAVTNIYIVLHYGGDATRISAQVVSGIGFLGVGTIIVTGNKQIKGLTTAAGLWASACMGLAIGAGFYVPAIAACLMIYLVMSVLNKLEVKAYQSSKVIDLYIEMEDIHHLSVFLANVRENSIKTANLELTKSKNLDEQAVSVIVTLYLPKKQDHSQLLASINGWEGIRFLEEI